MGVSVYTDHLISNLNLTRIQISTAYMIGTLISSLLMTKAGLFYDKFGARVAASGSTFFLGLFLIFLSKSVGLTHFIHSLTSLSSNSVAFVFMIISRSRPGTELAVLIVRVAVCQNMMYNKLKYES